MESKTGTIRQARLFVLVVSSTLLAVTAASLYFDLRGSDQQYESLAADVGRSFYQAIDAMRDWNLRQGGVYVRESPDVLPNLFLSSPLRQISAADGVKMTMVSHAHMTRLLSEVLTQGRGIRLHITGLNPIRPENKPEAWERIALQKFEEGSREEYRQISTAGRRSMFQYMAPLKNEDLCYSCHKKDEISQRIRGGISVSFDFSPFRGVQAIQNRRLIAAHMIFAFFGLALAGLMGSKLMGSIRALQDSMARIKRLEGFLPICSNCKRIRLEGADSRLQVSWVGIEQYIQERTDAEFTHGMCPACAMELYPEIFPKNSQSAGP